MTAQRNQQVGDSSLLNTSCGFNRVLHKRSLKIHPHLQSLALLNDTQYARLKDFLLDTKVSLLNLTECFNPLHAEAIPGCRLLNSFSDHISFYPCNCSSLRDYKTHLQFLDHLCLEASSSPSTLVVITDTSVIPSRHMQAVSAMHIWNLGQQISFSKTLASRTTTPDTKLFAIRLGIAKITSIAIECIILITDSLGSARQAVDLFVYSRQAYSFQLSALHLGCSFLKAMAIGLTSRTAPARLSGPSTNWSITM